MIVAAVLGTERVLRELYLGFSFYPRSHIWMSRAVLALLIPFEVFAFLRAPRGE